MFNAYPIDHNPLSKSDALLLEIVSEEGEQYLHESLPLPAAATSNSNCIGTIASAMSTGSTDIKKAVVQQLSTSYTNKSWHLGLNAIDKETEYDLYIVTGAMPTYNMCTRKRHAYHYQLYSKHQAKISKAIQQNNGIYKAQLNCAQEDNGANCLCTNHKGLLL